MAGRLLDWPEGVGLSNFQIVSGPVSSGSGDSGGTLTGETQYTSAVKAPWVFQATITITQGQKARRTIGTLIAGHSGANALRFPLRLIAEQPKPTDLGLSGAQELVWSNGEPWDNGRGWIGGYPDESVAANTAKDYGTVTLGGDAWGDQLGYGDWFGIDTHFAAYMVTGTFAGEAGKYKIWPPLRKAVTTDDVATLEPTIIVKTVGQIPFSKDASKWDGITISLVEIPDETVRAYYTLD